MTQVFNDLVCAAKFLIKFEEQMQFENRLISTILTNSSSFFRELRTPLFLLRWGWDLRQYGRSMPDVKVGIQVTTPRDEESEEILDFGYTISTDTFELVNEPVPHMGVPVFLSCNVDRVFTIADILDALVFDAEKEAHLRAGVPIVLDEPEATLVLRMVVLKLKSQLQKIPYGFLTEF